MIRVIILIEFLLLLAIRPSVDRHRRLVAAAAADNIAVLERSAILEGVVVVSVSAVAAMYY